MRNTKQKYKTAFKCMFHGNSFMIHIKMTAVLLHICKGGVYFRNEE